MRTYLAARIPALTRVESVTQAQIDATVNRGVIHRMFVAWDVAYGVFGSTVPYITISSRSAFALLQAQQSPMGLTGGFDVGMVHAAPLWALALGAFLETIDPSHLQAAMIADSCRNIATYMHLTGKPNPTL